MIFLNFSLFEWLFRRLIKPVPFNHTTFPNFSPLYHKNAYFSTLYTKNAFFTIHYYLLPCQIPELVKSEKVNPQGQVLGDLGCVSDLDAHGFCRGYTHPLAMMGVHLTAVFRGVTTCLQTNLCTIAQEFTIFLAWHLWKILTNCVWGANI